jgi:hypothetical protein
MKSDYKIIYLKHHQIDKSKWDDCIHNAENGLIYAYSFYLDTMSPGWDALVLNDYETVMPLTWKKKWGIHYLYQPFLTAQLGVFGKISTPDLVAAFICLIPRHFKLVEISIHNTISMLTQDFLVVKRKNFTLDLNKAYQDIYLDYNENLKRNIKKSVQSGCSVIKNFDIEKVIDLAVKQMKTYGQESATNVNRFRNLYKLLYDKKMSSTYGMISGENKLLSSCVFFFSHNRVYYILVGNEPQSKATGASHALIDAIIKDHANENIKLDFEGSDIPNLALFYNSYGSKPEYFYSVKVNRLPFYMKWIKK